MKFGAIFAPNYIIATHDSAEMKANSNELVGSRDKLPSYIKPEHLMEIELFK